MPQKALEAVGNAPQSSFEKSNGYYPVVETFASATFIATLGQGLLWGGLKIGQALNILGSSRVSRLNAFDSVLNLPVWVPPTLVVIGVAGLTGCVLYTQKHKSQPSED